MLGRKIRTGIDNSPVLFGTVLALGAATIALTLVLITLHRQDLGQDRIRVLAQQNTVVLRKITTFSKQATAASKERAYIICSSVERLKRTLRGLTRSSEQQTIVFLHALHLHVTARVRNELNRSQARTRTALASRSCVKIASIGPNRP